MIVEPDTVNTSKSSDSCESVEKSNAELFETAGSINHFQVILNEIPVANAPIESIEFGIAKELSSFDKICPSESTADINIATSDLRNADSIAGRKTSFLSAADWDARQNSSDPDYIFLVHKSMKDQGDAFAT